ncbi:MAG: type II toxin-antitoxin system YafQ family toxin [Anaerolineales bacterium]|nr:type II toxin-antitoxin system YafQ family toxin [Anaerolineales bacterium]
MRTIVRSTAFKKDFKRLQKRGIDMSQLQEIIVTLASGQTLDQRHKDHSLKGAYAGFRECHITPDWLLIYTLTFDELGLARTGSHVDLFE